MSLRYRLFLWISALFLIAGVVTYVLEVFITKKEMAKTRAQLKKKVIDINEGRRKHIEKFLETAIGENQARVDVLLERLSSYPAQARAFAPTERNYEKGTWLSAAEVLHNNNWLDFIQNTNQGKLASLIIPRITALDHSFRVEINEDMAWILMGDLSKHPEPYLGIRMRFDVGQAKALQAPNEIIASSGKIPKGYLLFSWKQIMSPDQEARQSPIFLGVIPPYQTNLIVPWADGTHLNIPRFYQSFQSARKYVEEGLAKSSEDQVGQARKWMEGEFARLGQDLNLAAIPKDLFRTLPSPFLRKELDELVMRYDQLYLIWCLAVINDTGIFEGGLFSSASPKGVAVHFGNNQYGEGVHTRDVFYPTEAFDDAAYFKQFLPPDLSSNLSSQIAVYRPFNQPHVFFGNTAQFKVKDGEVEKLGYLTLGLDADVILQKLVLSTHQTALLVSSDKLMGGFSDRGGRFDINQNSDLPISSFLTNKSGTIQWGDDSYYFITMTPFSYLDIHFVLLNPASKEFALLDSLDKSASQVVEGILIRIHLIGLSVLILAVIILHYLSRRITQPISQLATATCEIGEGHLEEVEIPIPSEKDTDEVASLCRSFEHMVKGLQEKEKVKAVLNKVVSQEIAQEILKGHIRLGGEEKKVSILFADIRNFTKMTQNMSPKEIIDLLNVCMTKISFLVDQHGGVIDKYVGDEAMALFGAPVESPNSAYKAILSAIGMIEALKKWNDQRKKQDLPSVEMGIGIHTGTVLAGNMGAENRLNYTVLGSNVNLASRLCSAADGMEILISESTLKEPMVMDKIFYEEIPPMTFKGFDLPVVVYRVKGFK
ncbi:MAG: HAMP domain-containing protein [Parachlamydiales bacterium]|nr:HAMP domain-containing protein [Candidatus Acheromyda pituitae]